MTYTIEFSPRAARDLESLSPEIARRVMAKIVLLREGLVGDVKRLTHHRQAYRLRIGDYRALFDVESERIIIRRVRHQREAYGP